MRCIERQLRFTVHRLKHYVVLHAISPIWNQNTKIYDTIGNGKNKTKKAYKKRGENVLLMQINVDTIFPPNLPILAQSFRWNFYFCFSENGPPKTSYGASQTKLLKKNSWSMVPNSDSRKVKDFQGSGNFIHSPTF